MSKSESIRYLRRLGLFLCALFVAGGLTVVLPYTGFDLLPDQSTAQKPAPQPARQPAEQPAQQPIPEATEIDRPTSDPYKGNLDIFEGPDRAEDLQVDRVMDVLGIKEGSKVADLGAGSGWFSVRAARRAGESGTVYAIDINEKAIEYIDERAKRENLTNIKTILSKEDDPLLPANSVDSVIMLKVYHEVSEPIVLMSNVRKALRPGGVVGIIDKNGDGDDHGIDSDVVIEEMDRAGFAFVERHEFVQADRVDYFLVFRAK